MQLVERADQPLPTLPTLPLTDSKIDPTLAETNSTVTVSMLVAAAAASVAVACATGGREWSCASESV